MASISLALRVNPSNETLPCNSSSASQPSVSFGLIANLAPQRSAVRACFSVQLPHTILASFGSIFPTSAEVSGPPSSLKVNSPERLTPFWPVILSKPSSVRDSRAFADNPIAKLMLNKVRYLKLRDITTFHL